MSVALVGDGFIAACTSCLVYADMYWTKECSQCGEEKENRHTDKLVARNFLLFPTKYCISLY